MAKVSIKAAVRDAVREDKKIRTQMLPPDGSATRAASKDSFNNFAQKLGVGADNALTTASYGFNPITRLRTQLEWIHRGSWLGGVAVDVVADDMTRAGLEFLSELEPDDMTELHEGANELQIWSKTNETIKWGRLYGGAVALMLIDGQDTSTPLRLETVGKDQFKGLLVLDRWMLEPALEDLVTDLGPDLGMPKFYRVQSNAPALRGKVLHYSRLAFRIIGVKVPYQQMLTENLWGISVIERLYDRMVMFDSASTGAGQLVYKSYLRTLSIDGMREVVSMGGAALDGLIKYTEMMRRFQGIEGITLIDAKDTFEAQVHGAFSGLSDALEQFAMQLSGALQIPLTRLFGQSPKGFGDGDNDIRNYYDHINQRQENDLRIGMMKVYTLLAQSKGIKLAKGFMFSFKSLWQLTETDKANIAQETTATVMSAVEGGLISDQVALQELRQSSRLTGVWTNITKDLIDEADDVVQDPMQGMNVDPSTGLPLPPDEQGAPGNENEGGNDDEENTDEQGKAGSQESAKPVASGKARRKALQQ